jgi:hypothetical protein
MFVQVRASNDVIGHGSPGKVRFGQISTDFFLLGKVKPGYDRLGHVSQG